MKKEKTYYFTPMQMAFFNLFQAELVRAGDRDGIILMALDIDHTVVVLRTSQDFVCSIVGNEWRSEDLIRFKTFRAVQNFVTKHLTS